MGSTSRLGWRTGADDAAASAVREVCERYVGAIAARDVDALDVLRAADGVVDLVHGDAFGGGLLDRSAASEMWTALFVAFPSLQITVYRTLVAPAVGSLEWMFTVRHEGELGPPIVATIASPSEREAVFRGVAILDVDGGSIARETIYLDFVTMLVELGISL